MKNIKPKRKTVKKQPKKSYVQRETIWKACGGALSGAGDKKICRVGKHKVLVERASKLDMYGNPVHKATVINKDGSAGASYRSNGSLTQTVSMALAKNGVETKSKSRFPKKRKR